MMKKQNIQYLFSVAMIMGLGSCVKKELPVAAHDPGNVITASADMNADYKWQLFFSLKGNVIVSKNLKTSWDLGFDASADGFYVILNSSKSMFVLNTGKTDIASVSLADTAGYAARRKCDVPSGNSDSTAIGDWRDAHPVYIVDRGFSETGQAQGFYKIQIEGLSAQGYTIRYAPVDGSTISTAQLAKDSDYNFTFFSFDNGGHITNVEPPKNSWDIEFTQYTHIFTDQGNMPYIVTGCVLNRYNTQAEKDSVTAFSAINYGSVTNYQFTPAINEIGYDWKVFNGSTYTVNAGVNYIVHTSGGLYYKLHFIDFYNSSGAKGNPKWEYQQL